MFKKFLGHQVITFVLKPISNYICHLIIDPCSTARSCLMVYLDNWLVGIPNVGDKGSRPTSEISFWVCSEHNHLVYFVRK